MVKQKQLKKQKKLLSIRRLLTRLVMKSGDTKIDEQEGWNQPHLMPRREIQIRETEREIRLRHRKASWVLTRSRIRMIGGAS